MDNWDEIRTAFQVARMGTVSGAAEVLGVHHATVIRHIDALEGRLGAKLFQRHARGYTATEAGQDLLSVAGQADDQFTQLAGRIRGRGDEVTGDLLVTSLASLSPLLVPTIAQFQDRHPDVRVRLISDARLFRLEYGEAHVAIRAGKLPDQPDNVVQPFFTQTIRLVASPDYVARHGMLTEDSLDAHRFIGPNEDTPRAPFYRWLMETVPDQAVVFRASHMETVKEAVLAGIGIGFVAGWDQRNTGDLVDMLPPMEDWSAKVWLVTHMDLHRTAKVQTFLKHLKEQVKTWPVE
ncbi:Transcriptional regulator, LysR family [Roseibacterium elongatum DSM 19469]|uniref:Transcriptional regulator, LysR family n=1 Tax=Roseicyclus elongatus DSM 19469 TaxID=1294273 RepID=W8S1K5_9RHOB|nr:LysR family transcriptional regulator [Roseibacterium elongatum]AHM04047.1 Transcriptional regulator, LysR family [Roseibacterium elongatum DSM 19469]